MRSTTSPLPRWILCLAAVLLAATPALAAADKDDHWYLVEIQNQRCGHMHAWAVREGDRIVSRSELKMELRRGESKVPVAIATEFVETADGRPIRMKSETRLGTMPTVDEFIFRADGVDATHTVAGSKGQEKLGLPEGEWLTPAALERTVEERIKRGDKEIVVRTIEPSAGLKPQTITMKLVEATPLEVVGKTVPALKWSQTTDLVPNLVSTEFTDDRGVSLRSENDLGGIKIVLVRADRAVATAKLDPPELLESTLIRPDKRIRAPRECKLGEFAVTCDAPLDDWPTGSAQRVTRVDPRTLRVHVNSGTVAPAPEGEGAKTEYSRASSLINSEDEGVLALRERALRGAGAAKPARAEALRKFVFDFIRKKSFDVGFASAAETARTQCGDCTEHAVLLCALLRADGVPARCVSGLVYIEDPGTAGGVAPRGRGFFGYHMWTQALLTDDQGVSRWIDLDAALSPTRPMDATHLTIRTLGLADGETVNALLDILPTLGKLKITVERTE